MHAETLLDRIDVDVEPFAMCEVAAGWGLRLPGPPAVMMHFVLRGQGSFRTSASQTDGDDDIALAPGVLVVVPRGMGHSISIASEDRPPRMAVPEGEPGLDIPTIRAGRDEPIDLVVVCGLVAVRYGGALGLFDHLDGPLSIDLSSVDRAAALFEHLLEEQASERLGRDRMVSSLMSQCLVFMLRHLCRGGICAQTWLAALRDDRMARALQRIVDQPAEAHTVESLALEAGMSRSAFAKHFQTTFLTSPMAAVRRTRLEAARRLMRRAPDLPLDVVARRTGFPSRSHFSRSFKQEYGVSPAEWRAVD